MDNTYWEEVEEAMLEVHKAIEDLKQLDMEERVINRMVLDAFNNTIDNILKDNV